LDGIRALAVLAVLGFHFAPGAVPGGFLGVDLFFVLSGYLITRMIVAEYLAFGRFRFGRFYLRRARRLLPGLAAVLLGCLAVSVFWRDQLTTVRAATAAAAAYVSNWWLSFAHQSYFVSAGRPSMLQHLWSLAVEEQFYLLWPVITVAVLVWIGRGPRPADRMRRWVAGVAAGLALASALEMGVLAALTDAPYSSDASRLYYGTDTHSMGLLLGAALGALMASPPRRREFDPSTPRLLPVALSDLAALGGLVVLAVAVFTVDESEPGLYRGGFLLVAAIGAVVTAAVARRGSRVGRALDAAPLRWVAHRSYAMYLWHWPVAVVTRPGIDLPWPAPVVLALRLGVTVALADLTYRGIERPIRRAGLRLSVQNGVRRLVRVVAGEAPVGARLVSAALVALVLVAATVLAVGPRPTLSAGQRALAAARGGRDLSLGAVGVARAPVIHRASPVARIASGVTTEAGVRTAANPGSDHITPAAPSRTAGTSLPPVSAYGDSVVLGARATIAAAFPGGHMDAVEGRQADPILRDVERDAHAHRVQPLVVIHVGDNGLIGAGELRRALGALHGARRVIVLNLHVHRPWEGPNNRTIARVAPGFDNVRVLDWHTVAGRHRGWLFDDQIHLTKSGAAGYAALLVQAARAVSPRASQPSR